MKLLCWESPLNRPLNHESHTTARLQLRQTLFHSTGTSHNRFPSQGGQNRRKDWHATQWLPEIRKVYDRTTASAYSSENLPHWYHSCLTLPNWTNEAGSITEVVSLILCHKKHLEWTTFTVMSLGRQKMILGQSWLHKHNPEIDWGMGEVKMSRCLPHCCSGCRDELHEERIAQKTEARRIDIYSVGSLLEIDHDTADDIKINDFHLECETPSIEEGDHILATGLFPCPSMDIWASSTISQRLAEAFQVNAEALTPVPDYLKEFASMFSKQSFNVLLEPKEWDHTVKLIPGSTPSGCKVYPFLPAEQKELDTFLKENLETGCIQPSKSLILSPVFCIKKKDGSLRLVQDYQALNVVTVKNKYLPHFQTY